MSAYAATKAFVLSFSEALWAEYRARGVHVLAVCPGATETNFFNAMGAVLPIPGGMDTAENVVSGALSAIKNTARCSTITGSLLNHVLPQLSRILPRSIVASIAERAMRPRKNGS
jgi:short-subunit dehydrogenase